MDFVYNVVIWILSCGTRDVSKVKVSLSHLDHHVGVCCKFAFIMGLGPRRSVWHDKNYMPSRHLVADVLDQWVTSPNSSMISQNESTMSSCYQNCKN